MTDYSEAKSRKMLLALFIVLLTLCVVSPMQAGQARKRRGSASSDDIDEMIKPELLNADTDPTLRYPIASFSGWSVFSTSYGWLDISRESVRYTVEDPPRKEDEGFASPMSEVSEAELKSSYLMFKTGKKRHTIFYVAQAGWGKIHSGPGAMAMAARYSMGTGAIYQAITRFDKVLATVKPPPPPPAPAPAVVAPPANPPTIVVMNPSVATPGQTIEASHPVIEVRGVAMDQSGLPLVTINGVPANLKPRNTQAVEFWSDQATLKPGDNSFTIVATNAAHLQNNFNFIVHLAEVAPPPPAPPPQPEKWKPTASSPVPLGKNEIIQMLKTMPKDQVIELVKENGIKFNPEDAALKEIQDAGGTPDLIELLKTASVAQT